MGRESRSERGGITCITCKMDDTCGLGGMCVARGEEGDPRRVALHWEAMAEIL